MGWLSWNIFTFRLSSHVVLMHGTILVVLQFLIFSVSAPVSAFLIGPLLHLPKYIETPVEPPTTEAPSNVNLNDLKLTLLNKLNGPTLHSNNGFHVVRATFAGPEHSASYHIHLTKTQDMFHPESLKITQDEADTHYNCFYTGTITQIKTTSEEQISVKRGFASLSSCHHDLGFEGLLLLPEGENFHIQPSHQSYLVSHLDQSHNNPTFYRVAERNIKPVPTNLTQLAPHKAIQLSAADGSISESLQHHEVVLKVPPPEFSEKIFRVAKSMLTHSGKRKRDVTEDDSDLTENLVIPRGDFNSLQPATLSAKKKGSTKGKSEKKPQNAAASSQGRVVDVAVFTDEKMYREWLDIYGSELVMKKINQYIMAMISQCNTLYQQPSMKEKVTFRLVHMEIQKKRPSNLNERKGDAVPYLKSFCEYAAGKNQNGQLWDHAMMFSGVDIAEKGNVNTVGIAWLGTMCDKELSCSLAEASYLTPYTIAHEVGHSFHMDHDGDGRNSACSPDKYIMAAISKPGQVDWSSCSMKNMKQFLKEGNGYYFRSPTCLTKKNGKNGQTFQNRQLPGQTFSLKEQCVASCGDCTPRVKSEAPYNNVCHTLYCEKAMSYYVQVYGTHPALEGSPCDKGKVCHVGKCQ